MIKQRVVRKNCFFCNEKVEPSYKEVANLSRFVSERGRIVGKEHTGMCAKHQRKLAMEIKRARHLALLPFVAGL
jgi:small subunit ribosomal protein S18